MRYVIANRKKAEAAGFRIGGHRTDNLTVILNEKEVMNNQSLAAHATLQDKAAAIGGEVFSDSEIMSKINKYE